MHATEFTLTIESTDPLREVWLNFYDIDGDSSDDGRLYEFVSVGSTGSNSVVDMLTTSNSILNKTTLDYPHPGLDYFVSTQPTDIPLDLTHPINDLSDIAKPAIMASRIAGSPGYHGHVSDVRLLVGGRSSFPMDVERHFCFGLAQSKSMPCLFGGLTGCSNSPSVA